MALIYLNIGKAYMITANIDVSDSLVNANMGTLRYIEHDEHGNLLPLCLEFPTSTGGIVVPPRTKHITTAYPTIELKWVPGVMRATKSTIYVRKYLVLEDTVSPSVSKRHNYI